MKTNPNTKVVAIMEMLLLLSQLGIITMSYRDIKVRYTDWYSMGWNWEMEHKA